MGNCAFQRRNWLAPGLDRRRQVEQRIEHGLAAIHHVLRQRHNIGDGKDVAAGRDARDATIARILDHGALLGGKARTLAGEQIHLGVGLAVHDVLATRYRFKLVKKTDHLKVALGRNEARRRR